MFANAGKDVIVEQQWLMLRNNITDAISFVNNNIKNKMTSRVYEFMPDFNINISKAVLQKSYNIDKTNILLYNNDDINNYNKLLKKTIDELKIVKNQDDLNGLTAQIDLSKYSYNDLAKDTKFYTDTNYDTTLYADTTIDIINSIINAQSTNYTYDIVSEDNTKKQILKVTNPTSAKIVQYNLYGEGDIYLPKLIALYQASIMQDVDAEIESDANNINNTIYEAYDSIVVDSNGEIKSTINQLNFDVSSINNIFNTAVQNGKYKTTIEETTGDGISKLTLEIYTPSADDWYNMFELDTKYKMYADEIQNAIENLLSDAGITDTSIKVDGTLQDNLFVYFEGFFDLPVPEYVLSDKMFETTMGQIEKIHSHGITKSNERGLTLNLTEESPVSINLLPNAEDVITDIVIYDVYDAKANYRDVITDNISYTYNYSAVQIAYYIDISEFADEYGFDFPIIITDNESIELESDIITFMAEYTCLSDVTIEERQIGTSILDSVIDDTYIIGYTHNGDIDKEKDINVPQNAWKHTMASKRPHLSIKTAIYDGQVSIPVYNNTHIYNGLSVNYNGIQVNPLLWYKPFQSS